MTEEEILVEYLRHSYHAVDGLWFMKVEEVLGFDRTLEVDQRVWEVLAKIQARQAQQLLHVQAPSLSNFARCFSLKLTADGFEFEQQLSETEVQFTILRCPWLEMLQRSEREHLAAPIAEVMCPTEAKAWCHEFGDTIEFAITATMCEGESTCRLAFSRVEQT